MEVDMIKTAERELQRAILVHNTRVSYNQSALRRMRGGDDVDIYCNCPFRDDRSCTAAPYYGTADCDWAVARDECPEPGSARDSLEVEDDE